MATGEISIMVSNNPKLESGGRNNNLRSQRPPPPPPTAIIRNEQKPISSKSETLLSTTELPKESSDTSIKDHSNLLSEFQRLFNNFNYESIREDILNRKLIQSNFTVILWQILLHCLPRDSKYWDDRIHINRRNYEKISQQYKIDPYRINHENHLAIDVNHPLSQDENSSWAQYFADENLKRMILIDVQRTFPSISYFRSSHIIDLQIRILFTHDRRHHSTTPYQQGMHEILGIIIYTIHTETLKIHQYPNANELMKKIYDPQYLEHDAYILYENMMDYLRQFYISSNNNSHISKSININHNKHIPFEKLKDVHIPENEIVKRMNLIIERLKHCDQVLYDKIKKLEMESTVYGIRWLRLLFGREIPFQSIPNLWTVIFSFDEHFGFVDYFFIALLIEIGRFVGKQSEITHNHFLKYLMQQNLITNVEPVIRKALNLTGKQLSIPFEEAIILSELNERRNRNNSEENENDKKHQGKIRRVSLTRADKSSLFDSIKISSPSTNLSEDQIDLTKFNSPNSNTSQNSKTNSPNVALKTDIDFLTGKTSLQQFNENLQLQKSCAHYMKQFIGKYPPGQK